MYVQYMCIQFLTHNQCAASLDLHVKVYSVIAIDHKVLCIGLGLNICLLNDFGHLRSSAFDVDFEWLMLHQCTHYRRP